MLHRTLSMSWLSMLCQRFFTSTQADTRCNMLSESMTVPQHHESEIAAKAAHSGQQPLAMQTLETPTAYKVPFCLESNTRWKTSGDIRAKPCRFLSFEGGGELVHLLSSSPLIDSMVGCFYWQL